MKEEPLPQFATDSTALSYWVYISSAARPFSEEELNALLRKSRENNERSGLTGMLLYKDGNFIQMLEGPEQAVQTMTEKIGKDTRHQSIVSLAHTRQSQRLFPNAWMGFFSFDSAPSVLRPQIDALLQLTPNSPEDNDAITGTHPARTLMQTFAQYM